MRNGLLLRCWNAPDPANQLRLEPTNSCDVGHVPSRFNVALMKTAQRDDRSRLL